MGFPTTNLNWFSRRISEPSTVFDQNSPSNNLIDPKICSWLIPLTFSGGNPGGCPSTMRWPWATHFWMSWLQPEPPGFSPGAGGSCSDRWPILLPNDFFGGKQRFVNKGMLVVSRWTHLRATYMSVGGKVLLALESRWGSFDDVFATGRRRFSTPKYKLWGDSNNSTRPKVVQSNRHAIFWLSSFRCKSVCARVKIHTRFTRLCMTPTLTQL